MFSSLWQIVQTLNSFNLVTIKKNWVFLDLHAFCPPHFRISYICTGYCYIITYLDNIDSIGGALSVVRL